MATVLVVDDEKIVRESLSSWLIDAGYDVAMAANGTEALSIIKQDPPKIVISDNRMPDIDGIELMKRARDIVPGLPFIIITAYASVPSAVDAMRLGAYDYVEKPFCPERIELLVKKLLAHQTLVEENVALKKELEKRFFFHDLIGKGAKMQRLFDFAQTVARSSATVLIRGESGTGKELLARAIHNSSPRADKPFVTLSCAALPESLLESELFGHEKGAFTGAIAQRKGNFELADTGTLFLDEIGDISANVQVHLLRVLEEREFTRVGGGERIKVDVRIISATNKDLWACVQDGKFREDLYYRLNVVGMTIPPLRERREDIMPLANHFVQKFARENNKQCFEVSQEVVEALMRYAWPGNVRELENSIEHAVVICDGPLVRLKDLPNHIVRASAEPAPVVSVGSPVAAPGAESAAVPVGGTAGPAAAPAEAGAVTPLAELEKQQILAALKQTGGNKKEAARLLGIHRMTLHKKLKQLQEPNP
ncbi:MAG: sigma-54 dependent transcriptional regulator [Planctomycetota bacterium]|nr:sigma-54 dependent transcriptional regulator [Planctomycetota bacterium]